MEIIRENKVLKIIIQGNNTRRASDPKSSIIPSVLRYFFMKRTVYNT